MRNYRLIYKDMQWFKRLKTKWGLNNSRTILVLIVFACTGFTVLYLKEPVLSLIASKEERSWLFALVYYILILPIYNVILLFYGLLFGQFSFFLKFEKRIFSKIVGKKKAP